MGFVTILGVNTTMNFGKKISHFVINQPTILGATVAV
jgi:hypothetical protein